MARRIVCKKERCARAEFFLDVPLAVAASQVA